MSDLLLTALENERRYVAKELHDGVAQTTLQLGLQVSICRKLLEQEKLEMLASELAELEKRVNQATGQVREVIADLRPPQVEPEAELDAYLQRLLELHQKRGGPVVVYELAGADRLPAMSAEERLALVRIVQEALLNSHKHAQAQNIRLELGEDSDNFYLVIADNGQGFDPPAVENYPLDKEGAGLANMAVRARAVGGELTISRDLSGEWLEVTVTLPKQK